MDGIQFGCFAEMTGWDSDKGQWKPVIDGDKLYWRGGADDA